MAHSSRTIDPGDPQDERVAGLSLAAAYTWAYLPLVLDDEGRAKDQPAVFNGRLWPLRADAHPTSSMADDLAELVTAGLLCRYSVDGRDYVHVPDWKQRQKVDRPSRSTLPRCPHHDSALDDIAATLGRVPEQLGSAFGSAAGRIDTARLGAAFARVVEDVTFPIDPAKAASYGQRIREYLAGDVTSSPGGATSPSADTTAGDTRADDMRADDVTVERQSPDTDAWRTATDDLSDDESRRDRPY